MGYNTTVVILNDALHEIANDPDFGKNLAAAISEISLHRKPIDVRAGNHANAASVIESHHADFTTVVMVGGNFASPLTQVYGDDHHLPHFKEKILKQLAGELGYTIKKKLDRPKHANGPGPHGNYYDAR